MEGIINIAIVWLTITDTILNYRLFKIRVRMKIRKEISVQQVILEAMKEVFSIRLFLNSVQMGVRILLMLLWVAKTIYARDIVVICTLVAIIYSLTIYFSFQRIR